VLHLLYARFWTKVMRDMGLIKFGEPFTKLFTQGMLTHDCYYREDESGKKRWFYPGEINLEFDDKGRPIKASAKEDGLPVIFGGTEKMSKSKNNVVEPREFIAKYGADTARTFVLFAGPPDQSAAWSDSGAEGAHRFLRRLWNWGVKLHETISNGVTQYWGSIEDPSNSTADDIRALRRDIYLSLQQADFDYQRLQYNTVVSACMKMLNCIEPFEPDRLGTLHSSDVEGDAGKRYGAAVEATSILLRVLYPIAPHITTQLWTDLGFEKAHGPLLDAPWPQVDAAALEQSEITLVVQVNGKLRGEIVVPKDAAKEAIESAALANENVVKFTDGKTVKKIVIVPGKLVSVVVA
jgi:leucyl-tRNA synthetase